MTNKTKTTKPKGKKTQKKNNNTPFQDVGSIIGGTAGSLFGNAQLGKGIGRWLGQGIGSIFGSGDYQMVGPNAGYNVLTNGNQIPKFETGNQTNVICHREYLGDITGTASFSNNQYRINPGDSKTFPWLSGIAANYQEYRIHGLIFEYRSMVTDFVTSGAPGTIVMATNYNADSPLYYNKQEMENSEFAISVKPTKDLIHGIECADKLNVLGHRFIRSGALPSGQDYKFTDLGTFQFATTNNPVQTLGELWVSYCVEFFKPIMPDDIGSGVLSAYASRTTASSTTPLGLVGVEAYGDLDMVVTATSVTFTAQPGNCYNVEVSYYGTTATVIFGPAVVASNLIATRSLSAGDPAGFIWSNNGVSQNRTVGLGAFRCTAPSAASATLSFGTAGTLPSGTTTVIICVTQVSQTAFA